ncbi:MAG: amino acid adenylation domain-containing protein [Verrucomicrobia bacterium]|nr:amino acid adenylation domain-containing protein [Verrucomicrobiota bacterium]
MKNSRNQCLPHLIYEQALRHPHSTAINFGEQSLSYEELERYSDFLASTLSGHGIVPDQAVAVCMDRTIEMVVTLYGILKAGGAYIPFDPNYPLDRLKTMLMDSQVKVLVGDSTTPSGLSEKVDVFMEIDSVLAGENHDKHFEIPSSLKSPNLAYIMYTSGSTGRPKGVEIPHRAVCNLMGSMQRSLNFQPSDSMLATTSISFDLSIAELFLPLSCGGQIILASSEVTRDGNELAELISQKSPSWMQATPTQWQLLLHAGWNGNPGLSVIAGGEEVPSALAKELMAKVRSLWVGYGPTETTVWSALRAIQQGEEPILIGGAVENTTLYLVNDSGQLISEGEIGELLIGGDGLARGYRYEATKTDEQFLFNSEITDPKERLYRSGDLFKKRSDGLMEFQGRVDHQVKIRGFRIELGEVENALNVHPDLHQAVAMAAVDGTQRSLVAGCQLNGPRKPSIADLRKFLARTIPEYMIPSRFAFFESFPLTPNNKIDRRAIADTAFAIEDDKVEHAMEGTLEHSIQLMISKLLNKPSLGLTRDFFEAGGNSLTAGQVITRILKQFGVPITWREFYSTPTAKGLAETVKNASKRSARFPVPVSGAREQSIYPMSSAQQRLWFIEQVHPGNLAYSFQSVVHLSGQLDVEVLRQSLTTMRQRHAAFRSTFEEQNGMPVQVIHEPSQVSLPVVTVTDLPVDSRETHVRKLMLQELANPFDLKCDLPVRWTLYQLEEYKYMLFHHEHHLIHDGWSFRVFIGELLTLYASAVGNQSDPLPAPVTQFGEFALAEKEWLGGNEANQQLEFWKSHLKSNLPPLAIPYDRSRPAKLPLKGTSFRTRLPLELCQIIRRGSQKEGVTLYAAFLAAFNGLLFRATGTSLISIGCSVANRKSSESEQLIGMFVNNVVLQQAVSGNSTYKLLMHSISDWLIDAQDNSDIPFDHVVRNIGEVPDLSRNPLFQIMFNIHDASLPTIDELDLDIRLEEVMANGSAKFDLNIIIMPHSQALSDLGSGMDPDSISILWEYNSALFEEETVQQLADAYHHYLEVAISNPDSAISELSLLNPETGQPISSKWFCHSNKVPIEAYENSILKEKLHQTPDANFLKMKRKEFRQLSQTEEIVANVWADVLKSPCINPDQGFFELGGHSLSAMQVINRLEIITKVRIRVRDFFDQPTIMKLAHIIDQELSLIRPKQRIHSNSE